MMIGAFMLFTLLSEADGRLIDIETTVMPSEQSCTQVAQAMEDTSKHIRAYCIAIPEGETQ